MGEFTPGPWSWLNYPDGRKLLVGPNNAVIHCPDAPIGITADDQTLISAAPDLLAAMERLLDLIAEPNDIVREMDMDNAVQAAGDAVAKAKGDL